MKYSEGSRALIINHRFSGNIGSFVILKKIAFVHDELGPFWSFEKASKPLIFGDGNYNYTATFETKQGEFLREADLHQI